MFRAVHCPWPVNHDVTCQPFHGSTDSEKLGTDVSFYQLSTSFHAERASIETTREQSVIVTSQLLSNCIDDVTIGQHFESLGAATD